MHLFYIIYHFLQCYVFNTPSGVCDHTDTYVTFFPFSKGKTILTTLTFTESALLAKVVCKMH